MKRCPRKEGQKKTPGKLTKSKKSDLPRAKSATSEYELRRHTCDAVRSAAPPASRPSKARLTVAAQLWLLSSLLLRVCVSWVGGGRRVVALVRCGVCALRGGGGWRQTKQMGRRTAAFFK